MAWCEENRVDYVFGLARNARLESASPPRSPGPRHEAGETGGLRGVFKDFRWSTQTAGSRRRRVIAKAEWTRGEANPALYRHLAQAAPSSTRGALYEDLYCARGEMENRIKECQLDLFADRTSAATMRANQLRLWFASMAYVLLCALRRIGLAGTPSSPRPPSETLGLKPHRSMQPNSDS